MANGHELLGTVTGTGCMSTAITGCFLGVRADDPLAAATEALVAFGVAGEDAAKKAKGPGSFHVALYDALVRPRAEEARLPRQALVRLHALVEDLASARAAVEAGATVVQLRRKGATTDELVAGGRRLRRAAGAPSS